MRFTRRPNYYRSKLDSYFGTFSSTAGKAVQNRNAAATTQREQALQPAQTRGPEARQAWGSGRLRMMFEPIRSKKIYIYFFSIASRPITANRPPSRASILLVRPRCRAEALRHDPLPRRSALARSKHSPTLRERVVRSIAVMASAWREVRAACVAACNQRPQASRYQALPVLCYLRYVCRNKLVHDCIHSKVQVVLKN